MSAIPSVLTYTGDSIPRPLTRRRYFVLREPAAEIERSTFIPKIISKPLNPGYGFKFAIFAGIHGDEEAGTLAAFDLIRWASEQPEELHDYELHIYPVCNPTGRRSHTRHSGSGVDLNRQFWHESTEPEVQYLEGELRRETYDGIISLHSDSDSDGVYGFVGGSFLSEHLLKPALQAASEILPRNDAHVIDGFLADKGIIREGYLGMLTAPPGQAASALQIVFEPPSLAPMPLQVAATLAAVKTILARYRQLQSYAPNL